MAKPQSFTVLIATDGSDEATAAVNGVTTFPWPDGTRVHGVVVRTSQAALAAPEIEPLEPALDGPANGRPVEHMVGAARENAAQRGGPGIGHARTMRHREHRPDR